MHPFGIQNSEKCLIFTGAQRFKTEKNRKTFNFNQTDFDDVSNFKIIFYTQ